MKADELYQLFNKTWGIREPWPKKYEVDPATYGYVCQALFTHLEEKYPRADGNVHVQLGPFGGVMFKGVELILVTK